MADQVTRKDIQALQKKIEDLDTRLSTFVNKAFESRISDVYAAILEGDRVAEQKVAPVRDKVAGLEKRVSELE